MLLNKNDIKVIDSKFFELDKKYHQGIISDEELNTLRALSEVRERGYIEASPQTKFFINKLYSESVIEEKFEIVKALTKLADNFLSVNDENIIAYAAENNRADIVEFVKEFAIENQINPQILRNLSGKIDNKPIPLVTALENGNDDVASSLIKIMDINLLTNLDNNSNSALHLATRYNRTKLVNELVKNGFPITKNQEGKTALHIATIHQNYSCVKALIESNKDALAIEDNSSKTALEHAFENDSFTITKLLIDGDAEIKDIFDTCVNLIKSNKPDVLELVLNKHNNIIFDKDGNTLLHHVALNSARYTMRHNNNLEGALSHRDSGVFINLLLLNGYRDIPNNNGKKPSDIFNDKQHEELANTTKTSPEETLKKAIIRNNTAIIENLISKGVTADVEDLNHLINQGNFKLATKLAELMPYSAFKFQENEATPLMLAAEKGDLELVKALEKKINIFSKYRNKTALDYATGEAKEFIQSEIEEHINLFLDAVEDGNLEQVKHYLNLGIDINCKDKDGDTALHINARCNDKIDRVILDLLLENGANIFEKDSNNQIAIQIASKNGRKYQKLKKAEEQIHSDLFDAIKSLRIDKYNEFKEIGLLDSEFISKNELITIALESNNDFVLDDLLTEDIKIKDFDILAKIVAKKNPKFVKAISNNISDKTLDKNGNNLLHILTESIDKSPTSYDLKNCTEILEIFKDKLILNRKNNDRVKPSDLSKNTQFTKLAKGFTPARLLSEFIDKGDEERALKISKKTTFKSEQLLSATNKSLENIVEEIVSTHKKDDEIYQANEKGINALHLAATNNNAKLCSLLVKKINIFDKLNGHTAYELCTDKQTKAVLENAETEVKKEFAEAIKESDSKTVTKLLDLGIDPNIKLENGKTALELCTSKRIRKILTENGAEEKKDEKVSTQDENSRSAIEPRNSYTGSIREERKKPRSPLSYGG